MYRAAIANHDAKIVKKYGKTTTLSSRGKHTFVQKAVAWKINLKAQNS